MKGEVQKYGALQGGNIQIIFFFTPPKPKDKNVSLKIYIDTSD